MTELSGSVHSRIMNREATARTQGDIPPPAVLRAPIALVPPDLETIYRDNFAFVWRNARRMGVQGGAVDDVVQDVFLVVHRRLQEFEGRGSIRSWLYSITVRVVLDHLKSRRRRRTAPAPGEEAQELEAIADVSRPSPCDCAETANRARLLQRLLDQLAPDKREILILAELEQMTAPEMSEALGVPVNTVYSRLRSARQDFEQALSRHRARMAGRPA